MEVSWPVGPEVGSVISWAGGQALGRWRDPHCIYVKLISNIGGLFIIVSDALGDDSSGNPPYNMHKALIFQAVIAISVMPCALSIGWLGGRVQNRRLQIDKGTPDENDRVEAAATP